LNLVNLSRFPLHGTDQGLSAASLIKEVCWYGWGAVMAASDSKGIVVKLDAAQVHAKASAVRVVIRSYFSTHLLWAARDSADKAAAIESRHDGDSKFDMEHRAHVLQAIMSAAAFLEAMINELFQDAHDGHGIENDGYIAPLSPRTRELMAGWWAVSDEGFEQVLKKYQLLLLFADKPKLDTGAEPYQSAKLLIRLRNAVAHYKSESVSADVEHAFTKALRGRFDDNHLMDGSGNSWWPSHALGAGCAFWAAESAKDLTDAVTDAIEISPNYGRQEETWFAT